jgi:LacI family transcriptional regulator
LSGSQGPQKPTLKTIAEATGLAVTTVSKALSGAPQIAEETRQRVAKAAEEIGYIPDRAAQRLRTGRTNVISLILDPHDEIIGFARSIIGGLTASLRETRYHLTITPHFADDDSISPVRYILQNHLADGIIFTRTEPFDNRVRLLLENNIPFVCHGRTALSTPHPFVDYDSEQFAYIAAQRLIEKGRTRLCIILPPKHLTFAEHLRYGFMRAVRENGVEFYIPDEVTLDSKSEEIYAFMKERASRENRPDGFVCAGETAFFSLIAALSELNLQSGQDFDIVAKDTTGLLAQIRPRVDTILEDLHEASRLMGAQLLQRIAGQPAETLQTIQAPVTKFV